MEVLNRAFRYAADVPAALATFVLSFDLAFGEMKLNQLRATSVVTNQSLHSAECGQVNIGGASAELLNLSVGKRN